MKQLQERSLDFVVNEHFAITDEEFGVGSMIQCRHDPTKSAGFLVSANLRHVELLVRSPYGDLLHVNSKLDLNEKYQKVDSEVTTLGVPPMKYTMEAKDFNSLKYTAGRRGMQNYKHFLFVLHSLNDDKLFRLSTKILAIRKQPYSWKSWRSTR